MKSSLLPLILAVGVVLLDSQSLIAQASGTPDQPADAAAPEVAPRHRWFPRQRPDGTQVIPESSIEKPRDIGVRKHTNHGLFVPDATTGEPQGETPQSIREVSHLPATGGSGAIAVIDAFHYPTALADFNAFSTEFGLPKETSTNATAATNKVFKVIYASGVKPPVDDGWSRKAALDIEWAHAVVLNARIVLVEAVSDSDADLDNAVRVTNKISGPAEVSMSYGGSETRNEVSGDGVYSKTFVVYIAASGDVGGAVNYPGCASRVIAAGGTALNLEANGDFVSETVWSGSGGGRSRFIPRPTFQTKVTRLVGPARGVPDLSFDAAPATGVSVYTSTPYQGAQGWMIIGGTSVASPALAASTMDELTTIYNQLGTAAYANEFRDITKGVAGQNKAAVSWDIVTDVGSPVGLYGK